MTYRADPVTQRDGSSLENSNCLMAAAATGLDYHTLGKKTSTGKKMREYSGDTSGGTNTDEIERAWHTGYDEDPVTRDGQPFDKVMDDLWAGRLVMLQVWHATVGGPCLSGSGAYGHGLAVAPEQRTVSDGSRQWLVADPWCKPPKWVWVDQSKLKAGAEEWVQHSASGASGAYGREWPDPKTIPLALLIAAAALLMTKYHPGNPSPFLHPPAGASGPVGVLFASTKVQKETTDVAIQAPDTLASKYILRLPEGTPYYSDADLTDKLGELGGTHTCPYVGSVVGKDARACVLETAAPYGSGSEKKPTVVYVRKEDFEPEDAWTR